MHKHPDELQHCLTKIKGSLIILSDIEAGLYNEQSKI